MTNNPRIESIEYSRMIYLILEKDRLEERVYMYMLRVAAASQLTGCHAHRVTPLTATGSPAFLAIEFYKSGLSRALALFLISDPAAAWQRHELAKIRRLSLFRYELVLRAS